VQSESREGIPPAVGASPERGGEATRPRRPYAEPAVWTERMLAALHSGVKGGKWYCLIDKVFAPKNLSAAWAKVRANEGAAGVDHQSVAQFGENAEKYLAELGDELRTGRYRPQAVRRRWIPKPGTTTQRPLGIPTVRDRIVQTALRNVLEPIWEERTFVEESYGFRPGRGCRKALRQVQALLDAGYTWVVDADIRSYFDTIDHGLLMAEIERVVSDGRVLALVEAFLRQGVLEEMRSWTPERGTPQGAVISPLLANIFLHPVDEVLVEEGFALLRYADDLVILCRTEADAREGLQILGREIERRRLQLHPEKTGVVDATAPGGFDFLGYHFEQGRRWPRKKSLRSFQEKVRAKTRRTNGQSLSFIIVDLNRTLRGWFEYFKHSHRHTFERLDRWIRVRLRSVLRHRNGGAGRGRGVDHVLWPNAFFQQHGLLSLATAHAAIRQPR
jgi:RNA-directed DNA polymerase